MSHAIAVVLQSTPHLGIPQGAQIPVVVKRRGKARPSSSSQAATGVRAYRHLLSSIVYFNTSTRHLKQV
jgi:hypothetical protein